MLSSVTEIPIRLNALVSGTFLRNKFNSGNFRKSEEDGRDFNGSRCQGLVQRARIAASAWGLWFCLGGSRPQDGSVGISWPAVWREVTNPAQWGCWSTFNNSDDSLGTFLSSNNTGKLRNRLTHLKGLCGCQVKDQRVRRPRVVILSGQQNTPQEQPLSASVFRMVGTRPACCFLFFFRAFTPPQTPSILLSQVCFWEEHSPLVLFSFKGTCEIIKSVCWPLSPVPRELIKLL